MCVRACVRGRSLECSGVCVCLREIEIVCAWERLCVPGRERVFVCVCKITIRAGVSGGTGSISCVVGTRYPPQKTFVFFLFLYQM